MLTGKQGLTLVFRDLQYFAAEFMSWIQLDIKGSRCVGLGWITAVGLFRSTVGLSAGSDRSGWINSERARTPASNSMVLSCDRHGGIWLALLIGHSSLMMSWVSPCWVCLEGRFFFSAQCNSIFTSEGLSAILFSVSRLYDHYLDHSVREWVDRVSLFENLIILLINK